MRKVTVLIALLGLAACAPHARVTHFGAYPPNGVNHEMLVYSALFPECPFREVALITGYRCLLTWSDEGVLEEMKVKARGLGGDVLVDLKQVIEHEESEATLTATVGRFTRSDCRA